jgi:hypothetical protein
VCHRLVSPKVPRWWYGPAELRGRSRSAACPLPGRAQPAPSARNRDGSSEGCAGCCAACASWGAAMTDSTLERDLRRRIDDKLRRWVRDSLDLYEMAGLPEATAVAATIGALTCTLAHGFRQFKTPPERAGELLAGAMRELNTLAADKAGGAR